MYYEHILPALLGLLAVCLVCCWISCHIWLKELGLVYCKPCAQSMLSGALVICEAIPRAIWSNIHTEAFLNMVRAGWVSAC